MAAGVAARVRPARRPERPGSPCGTRLPPNQSRARSPPLPGGTAAAPRGVAGEVLARLGGEREAAREPAEHVAEGGLAGLGAPEPGEGRAEGRALEARRQGPGGGVEDEEGGGGAEGADEVAGTGGADGGQHACELMTATATRAAPAMPVRRRQSGVSSPAAVPGGKGSARRAARPGTTSG